MIEMIEINECSMSEANIMHWTFTRVGRIADACIRLYPTSVQIGTMYFWCLMSP
jgi:hypothetical protein